MNQSVKTAAGVTAAAVAAVLVAAFALLTGGEKASMLGLTRHGELAVAVDAGGADVVALTGIAPGTPTQVLTVGDSGVPVWRAPSASSPTTTRGDLIRRGASADERVALGASGTVLTSDGTDPVWAAPAAAAPTTYDAADFTTVAGGGSDTATLVSGQIRFVHTAAALRYYRSTLRDAARAILAIPSGSSRVILIARVATVTTPGSDWDTLALYLRAGSVEADAPPARVPVTTAAVQQMPSVVTFRDSGPSVVAGDAVTDSFGSYTAFNSPWDGTSWLAIQWDARTGQTFAGLYVSASAPTTPEQFVWTTLRSAGNSSAGNIPTWAVVAAPQPGGSPTANQLEVDAIVWTWP